MSERARLIQSFLELIRSFIPIIAASPHQYQESEVNIHYRSPIRNLEKEYIEEDELRRRQEDAVSEISLFLTSLQAEGKQLVKYCNRQ